MVTPTSRLEDERWRSHSWPQAPRVGLTPILKWGVDVRSATELERSLRGRVLTSAAGDISGPNREASQAGLSRRKSMFPPDTLLWDIPTAQDSKDSPVTACGACIDTRNNLGLRDSHTRGRKQLGPRNRVVVESEASGPVRPSCAWDYVRALGTRGKGWSGYRLA